MTETTTTETRVDCANPGHFRPTPAVARISWPDNRFNTTTACVGDLQTNVRTSIDEGRAVLVEPLREHDADPYRTYDVTRQIKEISNLHRRAYSEPVKAILLEAPDHPAFDELPETLEERQKLPARFHTPHWMGDCTPTVWVCNVCWDEGAATLWPCATAAKNGGEVFAR
ncbi:hypothetical protein ACIBQ1_09645 [Nonomuraea sp. NPDC050153]|uniref:hypothetical protein n=1 Tax=Nonomuraea sp. NPDC050153 TaxID=3364359 RepID=UPI0037AD9006